MYKIKRDRPRYVLNEGREKKGVLRTMNVNKMTSKCRPAIRREVMRRGDE